MLDLTVIILTFNEQLHIRRCLENVMPLARKVYVVDCHSTDGTQEIAREMGATVVEHDWPGNQAEQFNWALDSLPIDTAWVLRLDADEYLTEELVEELKEYLPSAPLDVSALVFPLGRAFMGRILKHGIVNSVSMIRMFRRGMAYYEKRQMDEHLIVKDGITHTCRHKFIDDNRMPLSYFITKHNNYATREACILLQNELAQQDETDKPLHFADTVQKKRAQKDSYGKMPLLWRSFAYFCYRYFFKLGFLDGKEGFLWDFLQGWWYRTLVDAKVLEIKRACGDDKEKIRAHLKEHYNISI